MAGISLRYEQRQLYGETRRVHEHTLLGAHQNGKQRTCQVRPHPAPPGVNQETATPRG